MVDILIKIAAFIVAISVLVTVHEFGHYIVGRWCGMKVLKFSVGFGKPIWRRIAGPDQTEYCIAAIPLGGYVKFLDEREGPIDPADEGRAFNHKPVSARIAVLLAGPAFNFLFAVIAYWFVFVAGEPALKPAVGVVFDDSYAEQAGLEYGDFIVQIDGRDAPDWETATVAIFEQMLGSGRVDLTLQDAVGRQRQAVLELGDNVSGLTEPGALFDGLGFRRWQPPAKVASLVDGAARDAGIMEGDLITRIDEEAILDWTDLTRFVAPRPNETVVVYYERDGAERSVELTIGEREVSGQTIGVLGVGAGPTPQEYWHIRRYGPVDAVGQSIERTWAMMGFTVRMLGRMLTGDVSIRNISGPISIARFAGESAEAGVNYFLKFLAIVSISLGIINLFPIPILDGGQIVYQSIEGIKGSPLSLRSQILGQQIGIVALLLLMTLAFYNDIFGL
ncbi:MAG: RIP metalloprotease RseP [Gammaproteobacteria bacterium]|nr:RIP metalloprotease RseP [Gammaproteobacteria bacterium]